MELLGTGNFLRSAEMEYVSLIMQEHISKDVVERLGELGVVQFTDMNGDLTAFKRYYTPFIRRCDELEKKLKFFEDEMKSYGITPEEYSQQDVRLWIANTRDTLSREHRGMSLLEYWESIISERHRDYQGIKGARTETANRLYNAVQRRLVIDYASQFFLEVASGSSTSAAASLPPGSARTVDPESARGGAAAAGGAGAREEDSDMSFKHIAGIIDTAEKTRFGRIVFRASAGHAIVRFADITEPLVDAEGAKHNKSVFAVFFRGKTLAGKLDRICSAFAAHQHDVPSFDSPAAVTAARAETAVVIDDCLRWLREEQESSAASLRTTALLVRKWRAGVRREKAVNHTLNMFTREPERGTVSVNAWVLKTAVADVDATIRDAHIAAAQGGRLAPYYFEVVRAEPAHPLPQPPTHFHVNKVTKVFQGIVNTYGVPRYGEANPALFSIMTFPFLFGVMYGDIGHATILTLAFSYLVWKEEQFLKKPLGEMFVMAFKGRYMLLMMGIFSIYCGLVYNDVFSIATSSFGGTRWHYPITTSNYTNENGTYIVQHMGIQAEKKHGYDDVYPFGVDPTWHAADNDLLFFNSLKMKMAVIFGIVQMMGGLFLKLSNALHFKSKADLWLEAVPQIIFMTALFGYMVFLIILKWCIDWNDPLTSPGAPPSLIDTLINVVLKPGTVTDPMFEGQASLQVLILLVVFFTVPVMLLGKPLVAHFAAKKAKRDAADEERSGLVAHEVDTGKLAVASAATGTGAAANGGAASGTGLVKRTATAGAGAAASAPAADEAGHADSDAASHGGHGAGGHEEHGFGEVFIHQAIETIEFVLGSVSNTASYLRLWALSLAHSQLATVFWERAIVSTIEMDSPIFVFIGYAVWAAITLGVLLGMDVLECFLHALRLHWVEFQNKFYKADGYKFTPFSFAAIEEEARAAGQA